ncbi:MAG: CarD family transcriptional regulator [Lachnospiraceae bacterium]|nr:CarD family transcriptional regulator [Lachnospiraceae bacterium]
MFEKKDYIYSENMGVCVVEDITRLITAQKKEVMYYVLRSVYRKDKTAYIPVEHHTVDLRELITAEEAESRILDYPALLPLAIELGIVEASEDEGQEDADLSYEKEEENKRLALQYKMEDTLPFEERSELYHCGEVEFVLRRRKEQEEAKASKKKHRS